MKQHYVADLQDGQVVLSPFLVREKEIRTSQRTGTSWLHLDLADRTGTIAAKMWENFTALADTFERDDVVHIRGRVKVYKGEKELALEQIKPALAAEFDLADFLPHTRHDIDQLYAELRYAVAAMKNPWLQRLLTSVIEDPVIEPKLKRAPAAMTMHHAFIGGLLEHIHSLIGLSRAVSAHYPELDADLLLAGVVLHDIGKIDELVYVRGVEYTAEGRLLGHIMIGVTLVREKIRAIPAFPQPLATLVEHLILSHHGSHEFGSPSLPQVREAVALHFLDDLDSKMAAVRATLEAAVNQPAENLWTERNPSLRRVLLRSDIFLAGALPSAPAAAEAAAPARKPAPSAPPPSAGAPTAAPVAPPLATPKPVAPAQPVASPTAAPGSAYASLFSDSGGDEKGTFSGAAVAPPGEESSAQKPAEPEPEKAPPRSPYASPLRKTFTADVPADKPEKK